MSRVTARGVVRAFQVETAFETGAKGLRVMNFPRPGAGSALAPADQITSPRDSV